MVLRHGPWLSCSVCLFASIVCESIKSGPMFFSGTEFFVDSSGVSRENAAIEVNRYFLLELISDVCTSKHHSIPLWRNQLDARLLINQVCPEIQTLWSEWQILCSMINLTLSIQIFQNRRIEILLLICNCDILAAKQLSYWTLKNYPSEGFNLKQDMGYTYHEGTNE